MRFSSGIMVIMVKLVQMNNLSKDFKEVAKKDKRFFIWMIGAFLASAFVFALPLLNLSSARVKIITGYSDIGSGYWRGDWWYLLSFSVIAFAIGVGHNLLSVLIHTRYGKDVARLFLGVSCVILVFAAVFLLHIVEEG